MTENAYNPTVPADLDIHETMGERWEFNDSVTEVFDEMLQRSIPQYDEMRDLSTRFGSAYVQKDTTIMDIGCSRGEALRPFVEKFARLNHYVGLEIADPMLAAAKENLKHPHVQIRKWDLRQGVPYYPTTSLVLSILTLMFTPINYRTAIIESIYHNLLPGGALILVEKVLGETGPIDALLVDRYEEFKESNGYTKEEIARKKLTLEGVQVPLTAAWNVQMLERAGFEVDCFWRWVNFAGWVCRKK